MRMKLIKDETRTYPFRLWFDEQEIENIAQRCRQGFIKSVGKSDPTTIEVDKFIENYLPGALGKEIVFDPYADLMRTEGPKVLGATYFYDDHLEVKVERLVTQGAERSCQWGRYNAIVIHESVHCTIHPILFEGIPNQAEFFERPVSKKISCLQRTIENYYTGEWWEYQANQIMANILMPRELFLCHFQKERDSWCVMSNHDLIKNYHYFDYVLHEVARIFGVSKQAVRIRLQELKQIPNLSQEEPTRENGFVQVVDMFDGLR